MTSLAEIYTELSTSSELPEVDWSRLRSIEFQESLRQRISLSDRTAKLGCQLCPDFVDHVSSLLFPHVCADEKYATLHEIKLVEASLIQLKLALSDQNLAMLPEYESRVEVLKRLQFIDDNSTVLLKGRVACEVSCCPPLICRRLTADQFCTGTYPHRAHPRKHSCRLHTARSGCLAVHFRLCGED